MARRGAARGEERRAAVRDDCKRTITVELVLRTREKEEKLWW